ncbi:KPN_02809 family neutral zinc metallopeptidase [Ohtaekwangia sp.]|uniref:KPN_02809 family neutral zinc metallopeptidase n=1 Tax=Ohtaekwangia sp. TaxID=2066019 RepID=UPI002F94D9A4
MRWTGRRQSSNVEDQRGRGFGGGGMLGKGGLGLGGIVIIVVISLILGKNPLTLLEQTGVTSQDYATDESVQSSPQSDEQKQFVSTVLADTEDVWHKLMPDYRDPTLVLFTSQVESACGMASAASGPFYCPPDEKLYIDLSFYDELQNRFQAPGDFAQAYVIAHEVGHHVQHLLGITDKIHAQQSQLSEEEYNKLSVRLELQADFLAGVWAHHANKMQNILEPGDLEEALQAASAIGDDRLQMQARGYVVPDSFTHGTSEQRVHWFRKGFETGDIKQGDTFNATDL